MRIPWCKLSDQTIVLGSFAIGVPLADAIWSVYQARVPGLMEKVKVCGKNRWLWITPILFVANVVLFPIHFARCER